MDWLRLFFPTIMLIIELSEEEYLIKELPTDAEVAQIRQKHLNEINLMNLFTTQELQTNA